MKHIYLDHNSGTPVAPSVLKVLIKELEEEIGNPSSTHYHGRQSRHKLEKSRDIIARFFKVKPSEVIFTSGGTEGAALLIQGVMQRSPGSHVISSGTEHACVYQTLKNLQKKGWEVSFLPVRESGAVQASDVEEAITPHTSLITLMAVNNETGVKNDINAIAAIAKKHHIPFVVDGVAWLGKEPITFPEGVTAAFFSGHKIYAPKGIGFCICRSSLKLSPLFFGGNQEFNRRAGTENLPYIIALAEAISLLTANQEADIKRMEELRDLFEKELLKKLPAIVINGTGPRVCNTSNLAFLGLDGETLLINLDLEGISASHGSACSSGALEPSRILIEMGLPYAQVTSSLRFSFGRTTTESEVKSAINTIAQVAGRMYTQLN